MAESARRSSRKREKLAPETPDLAPKLDDDLVFYSNFKVVELKKQLRSRGASTTGLKAELVARLRKLDIEANVPEEMPINSKKSNINDHIVNRTEDVRERLKTSQVDTSANSINHIDKMIGSSNDAAVEEEMRRQRKIDQQERHKIVLWRRPLTTLTYFSLELIILLQDYKARVLKHRKTCSLIVLIAVTVLLAYNIEGYHHEYLDRFEALAVWCGYWVGLGVLSSVGLGTGLHTFILYLGPHIAQVTLAAWECNSLDFPEPPYPTDILCPETDQMSSTSVNMWTIMSKVRLEAFMWGAGTAIGELPPYFMARAARLSGIEPDDEELDEVEELERMTSAAGQDMWTRAKKFVHDFVERVGFFGILLCASVPNPLFDLAGITCGHCLVPFWTFFGATLIGKAVIKMHIQKTFVILSFSKHYVEAVLEFVGSIPTVGPYIQKPFKIALDKQKEKLHRSPGASTSTTSIRIVWFLIVSSCGVFLNIEPNILAWIFEKLVIAMIIYFLLSIINSTAQAYAKRLDEKKRQAMKPGKGE